MQLVRIEVKEAHPARCPINAQNCAECRYNMSVALGECLQGLFVLCGGEKEEEEMEVVYAYEKEEG